MAKKGTGRKVLGRLGSAAGGALKGGLRGGGIGAALGAAKGLFGKGKGGGTGKKSSTAKLQSSVKRLALRVKKEQLKRKLFKEQMKVM